MERRGLSKAEQDSVVAETKKYRVEFAREQIARRGVDCARFDTGLQMYSDLLKRYADRVHLEMQ